MPDAGRAASTRALPEQPGRTLQAQPATVAADHGALLPLQEELAGQREMALPTQV